MDRLPFSEPQMLDVVRRHHPTVALTETARIGSCAAMKDPLTGELVGYRLTVLIDPKLGVPVSDPSAAPKWYSSTMLVVTLGPKGERLVPR